MLAGQTVLAAEPWETSIRGAGVVTAVAVVVALAIAVLRARGAGRPGLEAIEPVLAGFPIGLAAAAGGLKGETGLYFPAWLVAAGGVLLLLGLLWRGGRAARPSERLLAVVTAAGLGLFLAPGLPWWWDGTATDQFLWPLSAGLGLAALVALAGVAVGRWRGGRAWAVLLGCAGGTALLATAAIGNAAAVHDADTNAGLVLALVTGLVLSAAGVYALLRPGPPPAPR